MRLVKMILLSVSLLTIAFSQTERWVYRYNGPGNLRDLANSIVYGADGNIYAAGYGYSNSTENDLTVISISSIGSERWVYRYNGPSNRTDWASSLIYGIDGNIYVAGASWDSIAEFDFLVISLTPEGNQRWVYRYNGTGNDNDMATSITSDLDGNIYAAGQSVNNNTSADFTIISLTSTGDERWVYRYNGPGGYGSDEAFSIVYGADNNIYAAGFSYGGVGTSLDFTVVSLTINGSERWIYRYNAPENEFDWAYSIVYGKDDNIYACGFTGGGTNNDVLVTSLTTNGNERWLYRYNGPANIHDMAYSIDCGIDSNLYVAGSSFDANNSYDFIVISLTPTGSEQWVYRYNTLANIAAEAWSCNYGDDGNIYAGGCGYNFSSGFDLTIISLTKEGSERWVYLFNGTADTTDEAYSLVFGADNNIYVAGYTSDIETNEDFTVISLNPAIGIKEKDNINHCPLTDFRISLCTFQKQNLIYALSLSEPATINLSVYNIQGQKILSWQNPASQGTSHYDKNLPNLSPGVYFLKAEVLGKGIKDCKKLIVVK